MLRSIEKRRDYGEEKHFRGGIAAFKHLRNRSVEESLLRVYTLEPGKLGFDSSFYIPFLTNTSLEPGTVQMLCTLTHLILKTNNHI